MPFANIRLVALHENKQRLEQMLLVRYARLVLVDSLPLDPPTHVGHSLSVLSSFIPIQQGTHIL